VTGGDSRTASAEKPTVGFIGLGVMGLPMALNVLGAGYPVVGFNRSQGALSRLQNEGGTPVKSVGAVAEAADVLITMLPASPDVSAVVMGEGGLLEHASEGLTIIDMSTIHPGVARDMAAAAARHGVHVLDAPVSGGEQGAIDGVLSVMVGGDEANFEAQLPLLQTMGKTVRHVGPHGAGQSVKAVNQLLVGGHLQLLAEGLTLLEAMSVEPAAALEVLGGGLAASRVLEVKAQNMLSDDFRPGFRAALHHKDLGIVMETAREAQISLPATALVAQFMAAAVARGRGSADHSVLVELVREMSARAPGTESA
jgi:2-hydroxy-3-oxopropionate reductase